MNKQYIQLLADLKQNIIQSRYAAARLANKEQLLLYFKTGKILSEKIAAQKWGARIIEQISEDLQKQMPGLRGFSYRNMMKMKQFSDEYQSYLILPSVTAELELQGNRTRKEKLCTTIQLESFFGISFTHHVLILNKCKSIVERIFLYRSGSFPTLVSIRT